MPKRLVVYSDHFFDWLFAHGTRVVEFLNTALLIGFTLPLIYNLDTIISCITYPVIYLLGNPFLVECYGITRDGSMVCYDVKGIKV